MGSTDKSGDKSGGGNSKTSYTSWKPSPTSVAPYDSRHINPGEFPAFASVVESFLDENKVNGRKK